MIRRKKCNIDKGIPWHRDITVSREEIIVGAVCLDCGKIIGKEISESHGRRRNRCTECQKKHRRKQQLESAHKSNPPMYKDVEPKYCVDCGKLMRKTKWSKTNSTRCDICQHIYTKERLKEYEKDPKVKEKRRQRARKYYKKKVKKEYPPKYCDDCSKLLPKDKWNRPQVKRCVGCQVEHNRKIQKNYRRNDREVTVGVECICCGKFTPAKNINKKYCDDCRELTNGKHVDERDIADGSEKYYTAKEYMGKTYEHTNKEHLGTYDTSPSHVGPVEKMKKKGGKPNFRQERKSIEILKRETLRKKKKSNYTFTEGDFIRGLVNEYEEE